MDSPEGAEGSENIDLGKETAVDALIFSERWILSPLLYQIYLDDEDRNLLQEWKQEIDREIVEMTQKVKEGRLYASQKRTLGEDPTERDLILFCIARFIVRKQKSERNFQWKFLKKCVPGGRHHLRELGSAFDTCMDTSTVAKVLAELYGIKGEVTRPGAMIHYYWQASEGNREVIDTFWARKNTGYARNPDDYLRQRNPSEKVPEDDPIGETGKEI